MRAYNNETFVKKAVDSILSQSHKDFELIIVNDGSTDKTAEIVQSFTDSRIRLLNQPNKGAIEAAYVGVENSTGDFIFLDADDEMKPNALAELLKPMKSDIDFTYSDYEEINLITKEKKVVSLENFFNHVVAGILFRKKIVQEIGFWDRSFILPEYDFLIRVRQKYKGFHVKKVLWTYNRHRSSMTADKKLVEQARKQIFEKYGNIEGLKEYL